MKKERSEGEGIVGRSAVFFTPPMEGSSLGFIAATDPELIEPTRRITEERCGIRMEPITQGDLERPKSQFAFSKEKWRATWEPEGRKKNNLPA